MTSEKVVGLAKQEEAIVSSKSNKSKKKLFPTGHEE